MTAEEARSLSLSHWKSNEIVDLIKSACKTGSRKVEVKLGHNENEARKLLRDVGFVLIDLCSDEGFYKNTVISW